MSIESPSNGAEKFKGMAITSNPGTMIQGFFGIDPARYRGKVALDIGSGFSDMSLVLRSQGVTALSVDPCYADLENAMVRHAQLKDSKLKGWLRILDSMFPSTAIHEDIQEMGGFYIAASCDSLPLPDNSVDVVTDFSFMVSEPGGDSDFVLATMFEVARVLKKGGRYHVGPYLPNEPFHVSWDNIVQSAKTVVSAKKARKYAIHNSIMAPGSQKLTLEI